MPENAWLNDKASAHYLGVSVSFLRRARYDKTGPDFRRFGSAVRYHIDSLDSWTSEQPNEAAQRAS